MWSSYVIRSSTRGHRTWPAFASPSQPYYVTPHVDELQNDKRGLFGEKPRCNQLMHETAPVGGSSSRCSFIPRHSVPQGPDFDRTVRSPEP